MHIKKIELDGFKSYAQKQVVDRFDKEFNAITGLNGSGKSNILDSICFVLGITNLTQIRASNLTDLVYKQGQAGIVKATVTITFDNRPVNGKRQHAPIGFEDCDEIVIRRVVTVNAPNAPTASRTSSYMINGKATPNNTVVDFFRSVGLNVNNPHFLIMQGRITKVLNMKPLEILGMIEEAAGTKMYDSKRQSALATIEKKEKKVQDIKQLMDRDILPVVERMKADRLEYLRYQKLEREIAQCKRTYAAFTYYNALNQSRECERLAKEKGEERETMLKEIEEVKEELVRMEEEYAEMERRKEEERKGTKSQVDSELAKARTEHANAESNLEACQTSIDELNTEIERTKASIIADEKDFEKKKAELAKKTDELGGGVKQCDELKMRVEHARARLTALQQGMTTTATGEIVTLEKQLNDLRTRLQSITANLETKSVRKTFLTKQRKEKMDEMKKEMSSNKKEQEWYGAKVAERDRLAAAVQKVNFDEKQFVEDESKLADMSRRIDMDHDDIELFRSRNIRQMFPNFRNPWKTEAEKDKHVHGNMCQLFRLKDAKRDCEALEALSGRAGYSLVVSTMEDSKFLMKSNAFVQRTTTLPLDTVKDHPAQGLKEKLKAAQALAPNENVNFAMDLITYDKKYEAVLKTCFDRVLIVDSPEAAAKICYDKRIQLKTISRDGSVYNPSGLVSGGHKDKNRQYNLEAMDEFFRKQDEYAVSKKRFDEQKASLDARAKKREEYKKREAEFAVIEEELTQYRARMEHAPHVILQKAIQKIEEELAQDIEPAVAAAQEEMKTLQTQLKEFEQKKKNIHDDPKKEEKQAEKELKDLEAKEKSSNAQFEKARNILAVLKAEVDNIENQIESGKMRITNLEKDVAAAKERVTGCHEELVEAQKRLEEATKKNADLHAAMRKHDQEMSKLMTTISKSKKEQAKREAAIGGLAADRDKMTESSKAWRDKAKAERKAHPWIDDEKEHFGQKGTHYDFEGYTANAGKKRIEEIEEEMKQLSGSVNMATMDLLQPSEDRVVQLQKKQNQLEIDKSKLMQTIQTLDIKKNEEIIKAYESVNKDFGNIFATLLPGTSAKLDPLPGKSVLQGIEIKVAFNNKWKESLGELSGGQRSLVALSLVLAMLKFRPAPIYILDEVDAALDLSHTQNIGAMIKKHFTASQFIIVSLKEGMFNHANVLFKTRFCDGTSQVTRTENVSR